LPDEFPRTGKDPEGYLLRKEIIIALGNVGAKEPSTVKTIIRYLDVDDDDAKIRMEVFVVLGRIGPPAKEAGPKLLELITGHHLKLTKQKEQAAEALGRIAAFDQIDILLAPKATPEFRNLGALALQKIELEQKDFGKLKELLANETLNMAAKAHVIESMSRLVKLTKIEAKPVVDLLVQRFAKEA